MKRYPLIDALRGICILLVIFHHIIYDLEGLFKVSFKLFKSPQFLFIRLAVVWAIFITSGISASLSHDNFMRAGKTLAVAMLITVATAVFYPSGLITFGAVHCLGVCQLLWALLFERRSMRYPLSFALLASLIAASLSRVSEGIVIIPFGGKYSLPAVRGLGWLGFYDDNFISADWFPLISWAPVYFIGGALGESWRQRGFPAILERDALPFFSYIGRHSLLAYLIHQPILIGLFTLF